MEILEQIQVSPEILGGTPVFRGTRVPVQSLFWHLEKGIGIDEFVEDFPSVSKEQIISVLKWFEILLQPQNWNKVHENIT
jgi:uncharacterized protein (DUF433 family)